MTIIKNNHYISKEVRENSKLKMLLFLYFILYALIIDFSIFFELLNYSSFVFELSILMVF